MNKKVLYVIIYLGDDIMPDHILLDDIIEEMIDNIEIVKLDSYLITLTELSKK